MKRSTTLSLLAFLLLAALGCAPIASAPQPPAAYLEGALNWMQTHAATAAPVDWSAVRRDALALAANAQTTADTYPAIRLAISRLGDGGAFLLPPESAIYDVGMYVTYPENIVLRVQPDGPAAQAGVKVGDIVETVNGQAPLPHDGNPSARSITYGSTLQLSLLVRRPGQSEPLNLTVTQAQGSFSNQGDPVVRAMGGTAHRIGYIELPPDSGGYEGAEQYPGKIHQFIRDTEQSFTCGWILDLRRNNGGNLWSYLAATAPLLGDGQLGGFVYPDGRQDKWTYEKGQVKWNDEKAWGADEVQGGVYTSKHTGPPVVLLVSRYTMSAGELVAVAFQGRPNVRMIGEPTAGVATLTDHTPLSDGAHLFVSGAHGSDKNGSVYNAPLQPDMHLATDWTKFGTVEDAALTEAYLWLSSQPACS